MCATVRMPFCQKNKSCVPRCGCHFVYGLFHCDIPHTCHVCYGADARFVHSHRLSMFSIVSIFHFVNIYGFSFFAFSNFSMFSFKKHVLLLFMFFFFFATCMRVCSVTDEKLHTCTQHSAPSSQIVMPKHTGCPSHKRSHPIW